MTKRRRRNRAVLFAVRNAAIVFAPCDLGCIGVQVQAADVMVLAKLGAAQPRKVGLGLIGAGAILAEGDLVIDPAHVVVRIQRVPRGGFAGMDIEENERNISNKIGRGTFTAVFFIQCLEAIGCQTLHLDDP
jgi:hypothetical protein